MIDERHIAPNFIQIDTNPEDLRLSYNRLIVVMIMFAIGFVILSIQLFHVSFFSASNVVSEVVDKPGDVMVNRAEILDRNGNLLAINLETASVYANPSVIIDVEEAIKKIQTVWPWYEEKNLRSRLSSDRKFVWIKRNITPKEQYAINSLGIPGVYFTQEERRIYPHGNLFSHILGYTSIDGEGLSGIEKKFDNKLLGKSVDGIGISSPEEVILSLDLRVQTIVREELSRRVKKFNAQGGCGIVLNVHTGEVLASVSLPDFDPHNPSDFLPRAKFNKTTFGVYEMGSTFKTFTMAMGIESGSVKMSDLYDVSEPLKVSNFTISDLHPKKDWLSVPEIFMYSSNIGSARIALEVGEEYQKAFLKDVGLLRPLEIELAEISNPLYPDRWGKTSAVTISYGHGIAVTPMHIAQAIASLVNGGYSHPATILLQDNLSKIKSKRVINQETSDKIRKLMRLAVAYGTGKNANANGYLVGGKTGSADKPNSGSYSSNKTISSFVAAFPMNDPKYVVFTMLDEPQGIPETGGIATGGVTAAPLAKNIIAKIGPILGVQPVRESDPRIIREFWFDNDKKGKEIAAFGYFNRANRFSW